MKFRLLQILLYTAVAPMTTLAFGQTTPRTFDVTRVREKDPDLSTAGGREAFLQSHMRECSTDGRYTQRGLQVSAAIYLAYGIEDFAGRPDWMLKRAFDIDGLTDQPATKDECLAMLQELLKSRFKLAYHWETRQIPIFALVIAKSGSKLKPAAGKGVKINGRLDDRDGVGINSLVGSLSPGVWHQTGTQRRIVDYTGLTGDFNFVLEYNVTPGDGKQDILTAIEQQLGLKIEPRDEARKVMVIDHIERPDPN